MKGLVFTEFLEYVEASFSEEMADDIIDSSDLSSGGIYTMVGTYHHNEMITLVTTLSEKSGISTPDLMRGFGKHLFGHLTVGFSHFVQKVKSTFELLQSVENYVHQEVHKFYPDAELPSFEFESSDPNTLIMIYRSSRPFADLAHGMIEGVAEHFGEEITIEQDKLQSEKETVVKFSLAMKE